MPDLNVLSMSEVALGSKRVLIRADLNVPVKDGVVTSDARIQASLPTIVHALEAGAAVIVMSHLGRPQEGQFDADSSLAPVAQRLGELLETSVELLPTVEACAGVAVGHVMYLCLEITVSDPRLAPVSANQPKK